MQNESKNRELNMKAYLDNAATTPVDKEVLKEMQSYFIEKYGNASSMHSFGEDARDAVENARSKIAKFINADKNEIIFTSGGTESDNLAIRGIAAANPDKKHIITSKIEHPAVLETCKDLQKKGYKVDYIGVNKEGIINFDELQKKITQDTLLVSIMHVNNEIGTIQDMQKIGNLCKQREILFHTDAVQSFGKLNIDVKKMNIDLLSASGHKINGPKGVGFLYVRSGVKIAQIMTGGGQERKLRSGTENVPGIAGFAKAAEISFSKMKNSEKIRKLRDRLIEGLLKISETRLNGSKEHRIYTNANISFDMAEGESILLMLDKEGIAVSTGSACSSSTLSPSHVLKAIGLGDIQAHGSIRFTLGFQNTKEEIDYVINKIKPIVEKIRKISSTIKI